MSTALKIAMAASAFAGSLIGSVYAHDKAPEDADTISFALEWKECTKQEDDRKNGHFTISSETNSVLECTVNKAGELTWKGIPEEQHYHWKGPIITA